MSTNDVSMGTLHHPSYTYIQSIQVLSEELLVPISSDMPWTLFLPVGLTKSILRFKAKMRERF